MTHATLLVATFICTDHYTCEMLINEIVCKWEFDIQSICTVYPTSTIDFIGDSVCSKNKIVAVEKKKEANVLSFTHNVVQ